MTAAKISVAEIETTYYTETIGHHDTMVPYLETIIEKSRSFIEERYDTNPEQHLIEELERQLDKRTRGHFPELEKYEGQDVDHTYHIDRNGEVQIIG